MIFSYNWLQSFFKKKLPKPEKLAELLTMHSFEVEGIEKKGNDFVLDIDVLPNRAGDCFSHLGIAKECGALLNYKFNPTNDSSKEDKKFQTKDFVSVEVKDKHACPRYTVRVITDVKVGSSPKWLKDRLKVCGLKPINNIVDIANYVMLETGQPLHAFDFEKISGVKSKIKNQKSKIIKKIIVRKAKNGEKITTLDEKNYSLDKDILIIADSEKPLAIAGIKGGKEAGIDKNTKTIVLESANFSPGVIRKGSRKLGLKTDASIRFEGGIDSNLTESAINQAAYLVQKIAKGKVVRGLVDVYPEKVLPKQIKLDLDYVERLLGVKISRREIINILKSLGFEIKKSTKDFLDVLISTQRSDISIPEDLIEEIARIYGYEKIKPVFPTASLIPAQKNLEIFWEDMAKDILKEVGFSEVYNYSFISENDAKIFGRENIVELENPASIEHKYLRPSLIPNLLKNVQRNQKYFNEIKIFELGKIFQSKAEKRMLAGLISGEAEQFYQLKGVVDSLLNKLGISNIWYDSYQPTPEQSKISIWHPEKCAEIKVDHEEIGFLGEISSSILDEMRIETKVIVFDIDFEKLQKLSSEETIYRPISRYPAAVRDLAILVPRGTKVVEVLNKINIAGGKIVRDVDLFDIYEGENIPSNKKNFAFHIIYQAENKTLSSKEISKIHQKIVKALEDNKEWQVRR